MSTPKVLTIGSALMDIFISSDQFVMEPDGKMVCGVRTGKLEVDSFTVRTGGGASNTAVGFARMGFEVSLVAETGRDELVHRILDTLNEEGVNSTYLVKEKKEQTGGSVILVGKDGERMVLVHRGAASMLDPHDISEEAVAAADWIHLSSISQQLETLQTIFDLVQKHQKRLSWNPDGTLLEQLAQQDWQSGSFPVEVLIVNKQEWEMAGSLQQVFLESVSQIVITNGSQGGQVLIDGQLAHEYAADSVGAVDSTGAGDAFAVGYVSALLKGKEPEMGTQWGSQNAASVVQQVGAKPGLLYFKDLAHM